MSVLFRAAGSSTSHCLNGLRALRSLQLGRGQIRGLLSSAYACEDLWRQQRLQCNSLKHITPERYFFELNSKYTQKQPVSAVDIDIYINSVFKSENEQELEHLVKRFRSTKLTTTTLESTHHAVCRFYLINKKREALLKILSERVTYGIFPDTYIYNILLGQSITEGALEDAFTTVKLMMLQEDAGNAVTKTLALHTLVQLMSNGSVGPKPAEGGEAEAAAEEEVDEDEIEYIRIPYLQNPWHDDHFDLTNRDHIFGKSLYFFAYELGLMSTATEQDKILSASGQITGLIFHQKWEKLNKLLDGRLKSATITADPLQVVQKHLELITDEATQAALTKLQARLQSLPKSDATLASLVAGLVSKLPELEPADIEAQKQLFNKFETDRVESIKSQLESLLRAQKRREIEEKKADLEQKKRLYYFFENFPKHEIDFVAAEERIKEIQSKTIIDEDYIPPENYKDYSAAEGPSRPKPKY